MSWLDKFFTGVTTIQGPGGSVQPQQPTLAFTNATVSTNPATGVTSVTTSGGGGGGGSALASNVTMPAVGSTVVAPMVAGGGASFQKGNSVNVNVSGNPSNMTVTLVSGDNVTLLNNGGPFNVSPTGSLPGASVVTVASTNGPIAASAPLIGTALRLHANGSYQPDGARPHFDITSYGAKVDGTTDDTAAIAAADAACIAAGYGSVYFPTGTTRFTGSLTIASSCIFEQGAILSPLSPFADVVTFSKPLHAHDNQQIFTAQTYVILKVGHYIPVGWFGAVGTNSGDQSTAINLAIQAASQLGSGLTQGGGICQLGSGIYACSDSIVLDGTAIASVTTTWSATHTFAFNDVFKPLTANGKYFACIKPGVGGGSEPTWNLKNGQRTVDGAAIHQCIGPIPFPGATYGTIGTKLRGKNASWSGGAKTTSLLMNATPSNSAGEYNGTGASLSSGGVLTTSGVTWDTTVNSFPSAINVDAGTFVYLSNCAGVSVKSYKAASLKSTTPPILTCSVTSAYTVDYPKIQVQILTGGALGVATFQWRDVNIPIFEVWQTPQTTGASVTVGLSNITFSFAAGTYFGPNDVTTTGTSPPAVTFTGTILGSFEPVVQCTTGGILASAQARYSLDGGTTFSSPVAVSGGTLVLGASGLTANFPSGTYTNDNVWAAWGAHSWMCFTHNGTWVATPTGANTVQLTDPSGEFTINTADAGLGGGIKWTRPLRDGVKLITRDSQLEDFAILCGATSILQDAIFTTRTPNGNQIFTANNVKNVFGSTLGTVAASIFIHGVSHGDNAILPASGFQTTIANSYGDGEDYNYHDVSMTGFAFAGFYCPSLSAQCKEILFTGHCNFQGSYLQPCPRSGVYLASGSFQFKSTQFGYTQSALTILGAGVSFLNVTDIGCEGASRMVRMVQASSAGPAVNLWGGRFDIGHMAPDGTAIYWFGGAAVFASGLQWGENFVPNFNIVGYGTSHALSVILDACGFPNMQPLMQPAPGLGANTRASMRGCFGVQDNSAVAISIPSINEQVYGP